MIRYTNYIRRNCEMTNELYFDIFSNLCDQDMRLKLESIKGVRELGEEKLWEIIEGFWKDSNPTYMRRIKAIELEMKKGELSGDFFTRLKLEYREAEMERMTPWSLFVCKLISCTPNSGQDNSYLRTKLLDMYRNNPDPIESDLDKFERVIREHKSMVTAR